MAAARLPNLGEMAIAPLFIGPFAAGLTERDGNFSQICRGETRNKAERNERNILTLVTKCRFAPRRGRSCRTGKARPSRRRTRAGHRTYRAFAWVMSVCPEDNVVLLTCLTSCLVCVVCALHLRWLNAVRVVHGGLVIDRLIVVR